MNLRPIENEKDYDWALGEVSHYFAHEPAEGTKGAVRFRILLDLIEHYEAKEWVIPPIDPIHAIRIRMEMLHKTPKDLAAVLGSKSRASEVMSRKRHLTMKMAAKLNKEWDIPAEILIQEPMRRKRVKRAA